MGATPIRADISKGMVAMIWAVSIALPANVLAVMAIPSLCHGMILRELDSNTVPDGWIAPRWRKTMFLLVKILAPILLVAKIGTLWRLFEYDVPYMALYDMRDGLL